MMGELREIKKILREYDGPELSLMEVCGSQTAAIQKNGIPGLLSEKIRLLHGPGCPVCVAVSSYIDRLSELSLENDKCVVTFGDLMRVPGSQRTLTEAGGRVEMVYSPMDIIPMAERDRDTTFVFAALGFETTAPVYALLVKELAEAGIKNVKLLTALKTMPAVIDRLLSEETKIDGFLGPGHVCVVTGESYFKELAEKYRRPFVIAGFSGEELLSALCLLVQNAGQGKVVNDYRKVVRPEGNPKAIAAINEVFEPGKASWRGLGEIENSGLYLKEKYAGFDAGSFGLSEDRKMNEACRCADILTGRADPKDCPLFGRSCTPLHPQGACMVSEEGGCSAMIGAAL